MTRIQVRFIIEILGRPPEHIKKALSDLVDKLLKERDVFLIEKKIHEPIQVEDSDLFSSFAEITLDLENMDIYFKILMGYMPAHAEIIYPENLSIKNDQFSVLSNSILNALHNYDAIAKRLVAERDIALSRLKQFAPHLFPQDSLVIESNQAKKELGPKAKKKSVKK